MGLALDMLPDRQDINVVLNAIANIVGGAAGTGEDPNSSTSKRRHGGAIGFAEGGSFVVPTGFPNDTYLIGLTSGEHVTVVPSGDQQRMPMSGGGNNVTVVLQINSAVNLMDQEMAQNVLLPYIVQGIKQATAEGQL